MKTRFIAMCVGMSILLSLSACSGKPPASTNLIGVMLDGITVGSKLDDIDSEKYTLSNRYSEQTGTVNYEEWQITADEDGTITKIHASFSGIQISINTYSDLHTVDSVYDALGENYSTRWYDREQHLKHAQYVDKENGLHCSFIYDFTNNQLVWLIIECNQ